VHDHFEEGDSRDAHVLEVLGVFAPWLLVSGEFVGGIVVVVEGVACGV
jgi:hypothetical protein